MGETKIKLKELAQGKSFMDFMKELSERNWMADVIFQDGTQKTMDVREVATTEELHDAWQIANVYPNYNN